MTKTGIITIHGIGTNDDKMSPLQMLIRDNPMGMNEDVVLKSTKDNTEFGETEYLFQIKEHKEGESTYKLIDIPWAELSSRPDNFLAMIKDFLSVSYGSREIVQHALENIFSGRVMTWISGVIYNLIFGPIIAINIFLLLSIFFTTLLFAFPTLCYAAVEWSYSYFSDIWYLKNVEDIYRPSSPEKTEVLKNALDHLAKTIDEQAGFVYFAIGAGISALAFMARRLFINELRWPCWTVYWSVGLSLFLGLLGYLSDLLLSDLTFPLLLRNTIYVLHYIWFAIAMLLVILFAISILSTLLNWFSSGKLGRDVKRIWLAYSCIFVSAAIVWVATSIIWTFSSKLLTESIYSYSLAHKLWTVALQPTMYAIVIVGLFFVSILIVVSKRKKQIISYRELNNQLPHEWNWMNSNEPERLILNQLSVLCLFIISIAGVFLVVSLYQEYTGKISELSSLQSQDFSLSTIAMSIKEPLSQWFSQSYTEIESPDFTNKVRFVFENIVNFTVLMSGILLLFTAYKQKSVNFAIGLGLDVIRYFQKNERVQGGDPYGLQEIVLSRLKRASKLFEERDETKLVIIAHSQGTIFAFDWLTNEYSELSAFKEIHLVTMGSPLTHLYGEYFSDRFNQIDSEKFPKNFRWTNLFRIDDYIGTYVGNESLNEFGDWRGTLENIVVGDGKEKGKGHTGYWDDPSVKPIVFGIIQEVENLSLRATE